MIERLFQCFTDPLLRAPTLGAMSLCVSCALVGVVAFLRRQSLLGETLSHTLFPGLMAGILVAGGMGWAPTSTLTGSALLIGGFSAAFIGYYTLHILETRLSLSSDSALCLVLSGFFGIGITLASALQFDYPSLYRYGLSYLYGQVATLTNHHVTVFMLLTCVIAITLFLFYREMKTVAFDRDFAQAIGIYLPLIDGLTIALLALAIVIAIRAVGVVLVSAMLIMPAATARQLSDRLPIIFPLAALFGLLSGLTGTLLSVELANWIPDAPLSLPTGPMIVLVGAIFCLLALLFAPERGFCVRIARMVTFRYRCLCENILKTIWYLGPEKRVHISEIAPFHEARPLFLILILIRLWAAGWIRRVDRGWELTEDGRRRGRRIVRLHRLWELYLVNQLGALAERVHRSAEEIEHVLTKEQEMELTELLDNPKVDPHQKPIPS